MIYSIIESVCRIQYKRVIIKVNFQVRRKVYNVRNFMARTSAATFVNYVLGRYIMTRQIDHNMPLKPDK